MQSHPILDHFDGVRLCPNGAEARCPGHDDKHSSLSIGFTSAHDVPVFHCHAEPPCDVHVICANANPPFKLADLKQACSPKPKSSTEYKYVDETGKHLFTVVRFFPKDFRQYRMEEGKKVWNLQGVKRVLYRLPELLSSTGPVFIVEGEKDVETLRAQGLTATCNSGGAGKWKPEYSKHLEGREVIIIPDNDVAGRSHACKIAAVTTHARIVHLPEGFKDSTEFIEMGGDILSLLDIPVQVAVPIDIRLLKNPARDTDMGNAQRLEEIAKDDLRYVVGWGWMAWNGKTWDKSEASAREIYKNRLIPHIYEESHMAHGRGELDLAKKLSRWAHMSESSGKLASCLELAESSPVFVVNAKKFDADKMALNCQNGVVDLEKGTIRKHDQKDYMTKTTGVDFDPTATAPRWEQFLNEIFADAPGMPEWMQRAIGYSLSGETGEQCFFLITGCGRNGKSTFVETIARVLGDYAMETPSETLCVRHQGQQGISNDIARLAGCRFLSAKETSEGARLDEAKLKSMTGGDEITARFLHKEFFSFNPEFKLLIHTNHKPVIKGSDDGIWRRIRMIPFNQRFDATIGNVNKNLMKELRSEAKGILAWAIKGCLEWKRVGLEMSKEISLATDQYRDSQDIIGNWMNESVVKNIGVRVRAIELYKSYQAWTIENGERPMSQRRFGEGLKEKGLRKVNTSHGWDWCDIQLSDKVENMSYGQYADTQNEWKC